METSKKVKLVTFAPHANFGTCLQSYALNFVLRQMGCDVEFIYNCGENPPLPFRKKLLIALRQLFPFAAKFLDVRQVQKRDFPKPEQPYILTYPNCPIQKVLDKFFVYRFFYRMFKRRSIQRRKVFDFAFSDGNYKMRRLYVKSDYRKVVADADVFITASDQIWNPFCGGFNPMMFLEFVNGEKKCVAYSSSIARPSFPDSVEARAKADLSKFKHIAVREQHSVDYLKKLLLRDDVRLVVDPTLLLTKEQWIRFSNRAKVEFPLPQRYIFCYFIGDRNGAYEEMVDRVKRKTGIESVITVSCGSIRNFGGGTFYNNGGPYEFVYLLRNAALVCTDSFHATLFSLKMEVDFIHILKSADDNANSSQNLRVYDILKRYDLMYKMYGDKTEDWSRKIDFASVREKLEADIKDSSAFLRGEIFD